MKNSIWYSRSLVVAQMILIVLILSPVKQLFKASPVMISMSILVAIALALWALATMRLQNFSVMPEPKSHSELLTTGPYRYIRHPMYSAVILVTAIACVVHMVFINYVFFFLLLGILFLKIRREEDLLCSQFEKYPAYRSSTSALIPHIL